MSVSFDSLVIGQKYGRSYLAQLWGVRSHHAISRGVYTPRAQNIIVLFVTKDKQASITQYVDYIEDGKLYWEGEQRHGSDDRIVNAEEAGDKIHLFYRETHHSPFVYYGEISLVSYRINTSEPSKFIFILSSGTGEEGKLLDCEHLNQSDKYFEVMIAFRGCTVLGDIELTDEELSHISDLIASEMDSPIFANKESLTVALFLVWMGIRHYEEGNFWGPVYKALDLPGQAKWQSVLGEIFLKTVTKYNLFRFTGEMRYLTPILAHGYVPDMYLSSYFKDVVLAIYKERVEQGEPARSEAERLVAMWRTSAATYEDTKSKLAELKSHEKTLNMALNAIQNRKKLERLQALLAKAKESSDLEALLFLPEDWLYKQQVQKERLQEEYDGISNALSQEQEVVENKEAIIGKLGELKQQLARVSEQVFKSLNEEHADAILAISVDEVGRLLYEYCRAVSVFNGPFAWFYKLVFRRRLQKAHQLRLQLFELFSPLAVRESLLTTPFSALPQVLEEMQRLLCKYRDTKAAMEQVEASEREISATSNQGIDISDPQSLQQQIGQLVEEISSYRMRLVKLGRGDEEAGKDELAQQRALRQEIDSIRNNISGDVDAMLACLAKLDEMGDARGIEHSLVRARKEIDECRKSLKIFPNPLYSLNESSRGFMFQGGDKAIELIHHSLLFMRKLDKGTEVFDELSLPLRITRAMEQWWHNEGQQLLADALSEKTWERGSSGRSLGRKPGIRFDAMEGSVKAVLPEQTVQSPAATFYVQGSSGLEKHADLDVKSISGEHKTVKTELVLEKPENKYSFHFLSGKDDERIWEVIGPGWNKFSLLFSAQGTMIESGQLPDTGVYIIALIESIIEPIEAISEEGQLTGGWSKYKYSYLDLEGVDLVLVRTDKKLDVFKRQARLEPGLYGGRKLEGVTVQGNIPLYEKDMPGLLFSVLDPKELHMYGIEAGGESWPVSKLGAVVSRDNTVYVDLNGVGCNYGVHEINLRCRLRRVWSGQCAVVPKLKYSFDSDFYPIISGESKIGHLTVNSASLTNLSVGEPFSCSYKESGYKVQFCPGQQTIPAAATFGVAIELPLEFSIPIFRWRFLGGKDWKTQVEEIWHEDLARVQVAVPAGLAKTVQLMLENSLQTISSTIKEGVASFDLRRFSDNIREAGKPVISLMLHLPEINSEFVLASIRTRWQAVNFQIEQKQMGGRRQISIQWEDRGRATDRVIRLWPQNISQAQMLQREVEDSVSTLEITEDDTKLPAGRYRLELATVDPWVATKPVMPKKDMENTIDILIGLKEEALLQELKNGLTITGFYVDGKDYKIYKNYWIEDIKLTPGFEGEMLLSGNVNVKDSRGNLVDLKCNPVRFYYEDGNLPFLEDKDGDGAMYCNKCQILFWDVMHCGNQFEIEPATLYVTVKGDKT